MQAANADSPRTQMTTRDLNEQAVNHEIASYSLYPTMTMSDPSVIPLVSSSHSSHTLLVSEATEDTSLPASVRRPSDRSSICRSPGWNSPRRRKRKKEEAKGKRQMENGKAAMDIKEMRQSSRLTKAPPTSKGTSRLSASMTRSDSAPVLHTFSILPATANNELGLATGRSSNDARSRNFLPWKSANASCSGEVQTHHHEGFVGGLKLQQATQNLARQTFQKEITPAKTPHKSNLIQEFATCDNIEASSSDSPQNSRSNLRKLKDQGYNGFSPLSSIRRKPERSNEGSEAVLPAVEWRNRRGWKGRSPSSKNIVQQVNDSKRIMSEPEASGNTKCSPHRIEDATVQRLPKPSKVASTERPPVSYREPAQLAETGRRSRRGSFNSFIGRKDRSKNVSTSSYPEDSRSSSTYTAPTDGQTRGRSWSFTTSARTSFSRPRTASSLKSDAQKPGGVHGGLLRNGQPNLSISADCSKESLSQVGKLSIPSSLQGLKAVARSAFSRNSHSQKLPHPANDSDVSAIVEKVRYASVDIAPLKQSPYKHPDEQEKVASQEGVAIEGQILPNQSNEQTGPSSKSSSSTDSRSDYHSLLNEKDTANMAAALSEPSASQATKNTEMTSKPSPDLASNKHVEGLIKKSSGTTSSPINSPSATRLDINFLPPLRHRTLRRQSESKSNESSHFRSLHQNQRVPLKGPQPPIASDNSSPSSMSSPPSPTSTKIHSSRHLHQQRQDVLPASSSRVSLGTIHGQEVNTRAKMFVICCNCRFFHDMPSKIYECMAKPEDVVRDPDLGVSGVISTRVKCPWCAHGMSTTCCEGWAAVVVMKERLH